MTNTETSAKHTCRPVTRSERICECDYDGCRKVPVIAIDFTDWRRGFSTFYACGHHVAPLRSEANRNAR